MRFLRFLEEDRPAGALAVENAAAQIFANCQPFLTAAKFNFTKRGLQSTGLFRGISPLVTADWFSEQKTRKGRLPVDSTQIVQHLLDELFEEKYGYKFRADSIFTVGSISMAIEYGRPYLVFPIGQFHFLWSRRLIDAYPLFNEISPDLRTSPFSSEKRAALKAALNVGIEEADFVFDADLPAAIKSKHEIALHCDKYYALRLGDSQLYADAVWTELGKLLI